MQQPSEDEQADGFVSTDLPGRSGQDVEHVVHGVAEDGSAEGNVVTNRPEGEHGKRTVESQGYAGEQDRQKEDAWSACAQKEGINEVGGETFDLVSDGSGKQLCYLLEEDDGNFAVPGCQADEEDQADE